MSLDLQTLTFLANPYTDITQFYVTEEGATISKTSPEAITYEFRSNAEERLSVETKARNIRQLIGRVRSMETSVSDINLNRVCKEVYLKFRAGLPIENEMYQHKVEQVRARIAFITNMVDEITQTPEYQAENDRFIADLNRITTQENPITPEELEAELRQAIEDLNNTFTNGMNRLRETLQRELRREQGENPNNNRCHDHFRKI